MIARPWRAGRVPGRREYGGVLIVPVTLNGKLKVDLMADKGATVTSLNTATLRTLGFNLSRPIRRFYVAIPGPSGLLEVPMFRLDAVQVGPVEVEGLEVGLLDLPPQLAIAGLLGVNFLERFRPTFDFTGRAIVLRQQSLAPQSRSKPSGSFR
ncbi:MAG: clan AA aspartic protease [Chloroflexi bacterium]|nr:clan AA aspartic protease [Chloroflexota bacterium]